MYRYKHARPSISRFPKPLSVFLRGDAVVFPESPGKGAGIRISAGIAYFLVGQPFVQLGHRVLHPLLYDILIGRVPRFPAEQADKVIGMIVENLAQFFNGHFFRNMADDVLLHLRQHLGILCKAPAALKKVRKELSKQEY